MPSPYTTPYVPREYDRGPTLRIADLIAQGGDARARALLQSSSLWGQAIQQLGQIPGQILEARSAERESKARAEDRQAQTEFRRTQMSGLQAEEQRRQQLGETLGSGKARGDILRSLEGDPESYKLATEHFGRVDSGRNRWMGEIAAGVRAFKDNPEAALAALADAEEQGFDPRRLEPLRQQIQQNPASVSDIVDSLLMQSPDETHRSLVRKEEKPIAGDKPLLQRQPDGSYKEVYAPQPKPEAAPNTIQEAILAARARGDRAEEQGLLGLQARYAAAGREPSKPADTKSGDRVADAWAEGLAFPQTQEATSAALESFERRGMPVPRKLSTPMQQDVIRAADTIQTIDDVMYLYEKVKGKVGPVAYRLSELGQKIPGIGSDADFAAFNTMLRGMSNLEIKRITGAQMSEPEADRLLKGMATGTLKGEEFEAAIRVMARNARRNRDITLYGRAKSMREEEQKARKVLSTDPNAGEEIP